MIISSFGDAPCGITTSKYSSQRAPPPPTLALLHDNPNLMPHVLDDDDDESDDPLRLIHRGQPIKPHYRSNTSSVLMHKALSSTHYEIDGYVSPLRNEGVICTSDPEEQALLVGPQSDDYWYSTRRHLGFDLHRDLRRDPSQSPTFQEYIPDSGDISQRSISLTNSPESHATTAFNETLRTTAIQSSEEQILKPQERLLRRRNILQLQPYTFEAIQYRKQLKKGGQMDAIVRPRDTRLRSPDGVPEELEREILQSDDLRPITHEKSDYFLTPSPSPPLGPRQFPVRAPPNRQNTNAQRKERAKSHVITSPTAFASSGGSFGTTPSGHYERSSTGPVRALHIPCSPSFHSTNSPPENISPRLSETSGSSSEESEEDRRLRRKRKALSRMLPQVAVNHLERQAYANMLHTRPKAMPLHYSGDFGWRSIARPGIATVRSTNQPRLDHLIIHGDSTESSVSGASDESTQNCHDEILGRATKTPIVYRSSALQAESGLIDRMLSRSRRRKLSTRPSYQRRSRTESARQPEELFKPRSKQSQSGPLTHLIRNQHNVALPAIATETPNRRVWKPSDVHEGRMKHDQQNKDIQDYLDPPEKSFLRTSGGQSSYNLPNDHDHRRIELISTRNSIENTHYPVHKRPVLAGSSTGPHSYPEAVDAEVIIPKTRFTVGLDVPHLDPSKHVFQSLYIENTRLIQLIQITEGLSPSKPWLSTFLGVDLQSCQDLMTFESCLSLALDALADWSMELDSVRSLPETDHVELVVCLGQLFSWLFNQIPLGERQPYFPNRLFALIDKTLERLQKRAATRSDADKPLEHRHLWITWLGFEIAFRSWYALGRISSLEASVNCRIDSLIMGLVNAGSLSIVDALHQPCICNTLIDFWLCIIRLHEGSTLPNPSFWGRVEHAIKQASWKFSSALDKGETIWTLVSVLCSISQVSSMGIIRNRPSLPPCWTLVTYAIRMIRLSPGASEEAIPSGILRKRDRIIRDILARCLLFSTRWGWSMAGAVELIHHLVTIFKSRNYTNLRGESPNFPLFVTEPDGTARLQRLDTRDAAFDIFLKLIVCAAQHLRAEASEDDAEKLVKRLLILAVPVSSAQFTHKNPPTNRELSRLYNRYTSVIIASLLDQPASNSFRSRVQLAQRYSDFKVADWKSRHVALCAFMHIGIEAIRRDAGLVDVLAWLSEMTSQLLTEVRAFESKNRDPVHHNHGEQENREQLVKTVQLCLGSLRYILNFMSSLDCPLVERPYPDLNLLQANWLSEIMKASIMSESSTQQESRRLIQAFLIARLASLPAPTARRVIQNESQDEFDDFGIDLDDPNVVAIVEGRQLESTDKATLDSQAALIIQETVSPAIYKLISKQFSSEHTTVEREFDGIDSWIDCWAGCGHVIVHNNLRDWSHYFQFGAESWSRIIESNGRRRVGLRFMYTVLGLDEYAYTAHKDRFIEIWLQSLVVSDYSIEHMFTSRLFSLDQLRHRLLRDLPCGSHGSHDQFAFTAPDLLAMRQIMIECIVQNLAAYIGLVEEVGDAMQNEVGRSLLLAMLCSMREQLEAFKHQDEKRDAYFRFCTDIAVMMRETKVLAERQESALAWIEA